MMSDNPEILKTISKYSRKPALFEPGEPLFWNDPHISKGMLEAHLNPDNDLASRRPGTIDNEVGHLFSSGVLKPGDKVLDLGCGPSLYASRLARKGIRVTGIDISEHSLNYAIAQARNEGLDIEYRLLDFFDIEYSEEFDAVIQTNGELNTFSDDKLNLLLGKLYRALKPYGRLVFDVTTRQIRLKEGINKNWYFSDGGFWRPGRHLVLEQGFDYPEHDCCLYQYIVVDDNGIVVYRNWFHDYNPGTLRQALHSTGFKIVRTWNDLTGTPYQEGGDWLAVVAEKSSIRPASDPSLDYKAVVRDGYNRCAADYGSSRLVEAPAALCLLSDKLEDGAEILDIGCGAGVPIASTLSKKFSVTGVDISENILSLARRNVPSARFICGDIMYQQFPPEYFDAVAAFYSIFHLPREEHAELFRRVFGWLKPGGYLMATLSYCNDSPYTEEYMGGLMYWSNFGLEEYKRLLINTGFKILDISSTGGGYQDPDKSPGERHPLVLARKP